MFLTKTALPRRTFLRGVGATIALPLLDAMVPSATALAQTVGARPSRVGFIYVPHGADMASWTPTSGGANFDLSPTLQTLAPFKDSLVVVSNLRRAGGQAEMHAAAASGWLSGAIPKRTEAEDFACGTTIDQVLARKIGQSSPFPSLEFATEDFTGYVGGCTPGYSCAYHDSIAWATPTTPLPMEINPRVAFERMFGDGGSEAERQHNLREDRSILDGVLNEMRSLQTRLGARDRARVANYLDDVREIERRIQRSEATSWPRHLATRGQHCDSWPAAETPCTTLFLGTVSKQVRTRASVRRHNSGRWARTPVWSHSRWGATTSTSRATHKRV